MAKEQMTKPQMVARLRDLANVLGRDADVSGSSAEIAQRLAEWEEEAAVASGDDNTVDMISHGDGDAAEHGSSLCDERVLVRMLLTAHMDAWDKSGDQRLEFAQAGDVVMVASSVLDSLVSSHIAEPV
ncbi:DNA-packaging protein FI [Edwardsiella tarda]|uniref:DNA-packaging protein FI n=1 Tax=Edwardsiella tarda TaxID=636 RepID=UPI00083B6C38|nr:DNA-packaging protein FI [Edwardsiella tarda]ATI62792.1 hypothetical protein CPU03_00170 [Edwardsiella tarda]